MSSFIEAQLGLPWDTSVFLMHWPARPALASVYEVFLSAGNVHWGQLPSLRGHGGHVCLTWMSRRFRRRSALPGW